MMEKSYEKKRVESKYEKTKAFCTCQKIVGMKLPISS